MVHRFDPLPHDFPCFTLKLWTSKSKCLRASEFKNPCHSGIDSPKRHRFLTRMFFLVPLETSCKQQVFSMLQSLEEPEEPHFGNGEHQEMMCNVVRLLTTFTRLNQIALTEAFRGTSSSQMSLQVSWNSIIVLRIHYKRFLCCKKLPNFKVLAGLIQWMGFVRVTWCVFSLSLDS